MMLYCMHTFSQSCLNYITKICTVLQNVKLMYCMKQKWSSLWCDTKVAPVSDKQSDIPSCNEWQRILRNIKCFMSDSVSEKCSLWVHTPILCSVMQMPKKWEHYFRIRLVKEKISKYVYWYKNKNVFWSKVALTQHYLNKIVY